jgi:hypothetical protein
MSKIIYKNEKIIHHKAMRDWLVQNGGVLLKTKPDLLDNKKDIYIFKEDSISELMGKYPAQK